MMRPRLAGCHPHVSLLPLTGLPLPRDAGGMKSTVRRSASTWRAARKAVRVICGVVAECNYAQRRLSELRLHPDRYTLGGGRAPASYGEFLFRSSGASWWEPSARERAHGALVVPAASR